MTWELENNGIRNSLALWGIDSPKLDLKNRAPDTLTFAIAKEGDPAIHFPTRLTRLYKSGQCVFAGRLDKWGDQASASSEQINYTVEGPWWYLDHLVYRQSYPVHGGGLGSEQLSSVVLGTGPDGYPASIAVALADVIQFAADEGTPISRYFTQPALQIDAPISAGADITCAQAIDRLLEYTPRAIGHWDYSDLCPRLHITPYRSLPLRTLTVGQTPLESYDLSPTGERPSGIDIHYVLPEVETSGTTETIDRRIEVDSYPPVSSSSPFGRLHTTVDLTQDPDSPRPVGLARQYFESIPCRSFEGTVTLLDEEVSGPWLGRAVRILGGREEYAQYPLAVQSASHDLETGKTTLQVGAPEHLMPSTWIEQQRALTHAFRR